MSVSEPLVQASLLGEAIDGGPSAVFVADERMHYVAVNQFACDLLGYSREELLRLRVTDVAGDADAADEFTEMMRSRARSGTASLVRKDGGVVLVRYSARETRVAGMPVYVTMVCPAP